MWRKEAGERNPASDKFAPAGEASLKRGGRRLDALRHSARAAAENDQRVHGLTSVTRSEATALSQAPAKTA